MSKINLLMCGDFAPCRRFEEIVMITQEKIFGDVLEIIRSSDFSFVNLECPLTLSNIPIKKSGPNIKANPKCINSLKDFSLIGLSNNHILDYGIAGLKDTIENCEKNGLNTVGANLVGSKKKDFYVLEKDNFKIAIIALAEEEFNRLNNSGAIILDVIENYYQINKAKEEADIVILTIHAGNEYFPYPRPSFRKQCKYFIDLGVDVIVSHHPHVPGAFESYKGKPIFYSLGNLIFDNDNPPKDWDLGFMVQLHIESLTKDISFTIIPYKQSIELKGIALLKSDEKNFFLDRIEEYKNILNDDSRYLLEWNKFISKHKDNYLNRHYIPPLFKGFGFLLKKMGLSSKFYEKDNLLNKLNMVRCDSHREVLQNSLELESNKINWN
jgi:hypothetical protein